LHGSDVAEREIGPNANFVSLGIPLALVGQKLTSLNPTPLVPTTPFGLTNMRLSVSAILLPLAMCQPGLSQSEPYSVPDLQRAYAANNREQRPTVSLMDWGTPLFLLYPDGRLLVGSHRSNRPEFAPLSDSELSDVLSKISRIAEGLWGLSGDYDLSPNGVVISDQQTHVLTLRVPGMQEIRVSVYGNLDPPLEGSLSPPKAFTTLLKLLPTLIPNRTQPWDPGYVEVYWSDYSYAPDLSVPWPKAWPGLSSPLVRRGKEGDMIRYFMVFPSSMLDDLERVLASRAQRGAILIDGWKGHANYRWPLPNEKKWSSWTQ
jgi:hypothetical protein